MPQSVADRRHLVLIGLMGVGKSTVGRRCAHLLGRRFVDTDDVLVELARAPLAEAFATLGEARLRDLEDQVVAETVGSDEALVIACGGGTVVRLTNRELVRAAGIVIWLRAPTGVLIKRVGSGDGRPMLAHNPADSLERLASTRAPAYKAAADAIVDSVAAIDTVAELVLAQFYEAQRGSIERRRPPSPPV
ncbi:MAG: shikimate kinase [Chloroflexi bacterium]|nr:shikimate kinase [Chloroflexota bacterium]